jgi:hypothetical protein
MSVGRFTVLAGDFDTTPNSCRIDGQHLVFPKPRAAARTLRIQWKSTERVPTSEIIALEIINQETGKSFGGAAAAAIAGGLLLGGIGALAGGLAGGNRNAVTFKLGLRDGRALLGTAKPNVFQMLQAAAFSAGVR